MTELAKTEGYATRAFVRRMGAFAPVIFLLALMIVFTVLEPRFVSSINLFNVMRQISITGLVAIGMTFVILTAGIDLSVGSLLALAGLAAAIVAKGGIESRFSVGIETEALGYGWFAAMIVALIAGGGPISGFDEHYVWWGQGRIGPVPVPVIVFLAFAALAHIVLTYTRFGRHVYAVGGNAEAARLSGLPVRRILVAVYVIVGFFSGLAGFMLSARLNSSEAVAGIGYELTVIASVVIGGTSLFGGTGSVVGTVIGSILIGVLINGLVLMNVSSYVQQIIIVIIVLAVAFDQFAKSR
jgi:inositol transport system permease protein